MPDARTTRRRDLQRHIDKSRAVRRLAVRIAVAVAAVAVVVLVAGAGLAVFLAVAALAGIIGGSGVWITYGHIADFQRQLRDLR